MGSPTVDTFPDVIRIEPVGICNFKCIHCPTGTQPNLRQALKIDKFLHIINQFKSRSFIPRVVVLYHGGEPLLNPNLPDYIRILKEYGVSKVHIVTNGSQLSEQTSEKIINAGIDEVHISFDGVSAEENDKIRRNGIFLRDAQNVKSFYRIYKTISTKKIRILISNVQILKHGTNPQDQPMETPRYLLEYFHGDCPEIEFQSLPAMVWPGYRETDKYMIETLPEQSPDYCSSLFETVTIMANGNVVSCCYDLPGEVVFGNIFDNDIFDIYNNEMYTKFRTDFKRRSYSDLCKKCILISPRYLRQNEC